MSSRRYIADKTTRQVLGFYYNVDKCDVHAFNRLAMTLTRLGVVHYMMMEFWDEMVADEHFGGDTDDYYIYNYDIVEHVDCCVVSIKGEEECSDYEIR